MPPKFIIRASTGLVGPAIIPKKEVTLLKHQLEHFERICGIIENFPGYVDVSTMGRGKTYVLAAVALKYNIPFFVVCPNAEPWNKIDRDFDLKGLFTGTITYGKMAGVAGHDLNHLYLTRVDSVSEGGRANTEFIPTQEWIDICRSERGILIVLDEVHSIKNKNSMRSKAAKALIRTVVEICGNSRFAFLSATYFDKIEHARSFVMSMGFVKSDTMIDFNVGTRELEYTGIIELVAVCDKIDSKATTESIGHYKKIDKDNVNQITYDLYVDIIHKRMGSEMPDNLPKRNYRGFFKLSRPEDRQLFFQAVADLKEASQYNDQTNQVGKVDIDKVREALGTFGKSIVYDMCRFQIEFLRANPTGKVVFYMNNLEPVDRVEEIMSNSGYPCVVVTGDAVKPSDRLNVINRFRNSKEIKCIILTVQVGAQSLNLHDENGFNPINSVCTPGYRLIDIHQASGRSNRTNQLSLPHFYMFYPLEQLSGIMGKILVRLAEKGKVVMSTRMASSDPSEMPGGYPRFFEGHGFVDEAFLVESDLEDDDSLISAVKDNQLQDVRFMIPVNPPLTEISGMDQERLLTHVATLKNMNIIDAPAMVRDLERGAEVKYVLIKSDLTKPGPLNTSVPPSSFMNLTQTNGPRMNLFAPLGNVPSPSPAPFSLVPPAPFQLPPSPSRSLLQPSTTPSPLVPPPSPSRFLLQPLLIPPPLSTSALPPTAGGNTLVPTPFAQAGYHNPTK